MITEMSLWRSLQRDNNTKVLNTYISGGLSRYVIYLSEALHERRFCSLSEEIAAKKRIKLILIAGPSSSGKTTSAKRLAIHLRIAGLNPIILSTDDYFVNRDDTPRDENGEFDFECLEAMDLSLLNHDLTALFEGREIEMPRYDFIKGERYYAGDRLRLNEGDVLIMEGIHGLNPKLTQSIPDEVKHKLFVSVLTPISISENVTVEAADYRLLRRIVRDNRSRNSSAESTILRWPSVRSGEEKYINPFRSLADEDFNSALMYELPILKCYAEPVLQGVRKDSPAYGQAQRLIAILHEIVALTPSDIRHIPPTSLIREFIGDSSFTY